jgi:polar amino acid transport system substrate-binding protein
MLEALVLVILALHPALAAERLILATQDNKPAAYLVEDRPAGVLVDIVTEAFRRCGRQVDIVLLPLARALTEARSGEIGGVFSLFRTPERETYLLYTSEPLALESQSFFVRKGSALSFDGDLKRLKDANLGVVNGASHGRSLDDALAAGSFSHVERVTTLSSLIKMLAAGRVDLITSSRDSVWQAADILGQREQIAELSPQVDTVPSYVTLTPTGDHAALAIDFSAALRAMKEDGTVDKIVRRYRH